MEAISEPQTMSNGDLTRLADPILEAMRKGVRRALVVHHKMGQEVVTWRDGKIAIVPAAELLAEIDAVAARESATAPRS